VKTNGGLCIDLARDRCGEPRASWEAAISRSKRVIGDALRSREDARREGEVKIAVKALDRRLELGRPIRVRVA
jgi:hypothetical protein